MTVRGPGAEAPLAGRENTSVLRKTASSQSPSVPKNPASDRPFRNRSAGRSHAGTVRERQNTALMHRLNKNLPNLRLCGARLAIWIVFQLIVAYFAQFVQHLFPIFVRPNPFISVQKCFSTLLHRRRYAILLLMIPSAAQRSKGALLCLNI